MEELMERLGAAAAALERVAEQMAERGIAFAAEAEQRVGRIVATVESQREGELAERLRLTEDKLIAAESRVAELTAAAAKVEPAGRKTMSAGTTAMLSKSGVSVDGLETGRMEAASLDAALSSLSIEQRFAVKAELFRNGLLG